MHRRRFVSRPFDWQARKLLRPVHRPDCRADIKLPCSKTPVTISIVSPTLRPAASEAFRLSQALRPSEPSRLRPVARAFTLRTGHFLLRDHLAACSHRSKKVCRAAGPTACRLCKLLYCSGGESIESRGKRLNIGPAALPAMPANHRKYVRIRSPVRLINGRIAKLCRFRVV